MSRDSRQEFVRLRDDFRDKLPKECANCGTDSDLTLHHIVPLALGGTNKITNISVLCGKCHGLVHGSNWSNHSKATRKGIERAKKAGRIGGRPNVNQEKVDEALSLYDSRDYSVPKITELTGVSKTTLYKYLRERKEKDAS